MHSASWDHGVDLDNKTIGVVGTGSTSVQIVPQLQKIAKQVQVYMRSPTWISPPFGGGALTTIQKGQDVDPGQRQYKFTEEDIRRFKEDPEFHLDFRRGIEAEINGKLATSCFRCGTNPPQVSLACTGRIPSYRTRSAKS